MQRRTVLSLVCSSFLAAVVLSPSIANAKGCAGVNMPDTMSVDGKQLVLNGLGLREATILNIDVYVAGLYLEQRSTDAAKIIEQETTKVVRLSLVRNVSRSELADQMGTSFRRAAGKDYDKLKARFERMAGWLPDLKKGDTFTVIYRPGTGLELLHDSKSLGTIPGADYARTIFAIWLGDKPPNAGLKSGMLGGKCG